MTTIEPPLSLLDLCQLYEIDMAHGRQVGRLCAELFEVTAPVHGLPADYQRTALLAGLLHNIAVARFGSSKHHKRGRDLILKHPLTDVSDNERAVIALSTAFHRKPWTLERLDDEPSWQALPDDLRPAGLCLSALVRIADGLDYSHTQATLIGGGEASAEGVYISVLGEYAEIDGARAHDKADMWRLVYNMPFDVYLYAD